MNTSAIYIVYILWSAFTCCVQGFCYVTGAVVYTVEPPFKLTIQYNKMQTRVFDEKFF